MNIKKIGVDTNYATYEELKRRHVVAQGWNEFGDLTFLLDESEDIEEYLPRITYGSQGGKNTFNQLFRKIKTGDIILALEGNQIKGITEIPDKFIYCYDEEYDYSNSLFPVTWIDWSVFCKNTSLLSQKGQGAPGIVNCNLTDINNYINKNWKRFKEYNNIVLQPNECNTKLNELIRTKDDRIKQTKINFMNALNSEKQIKTVMDIVDNLIIPNHNLILTGAPGTGKTHLAKQIAEQMILESIKEKTKDEIKDKDKENLLKEHCGFVQFHPSYDYTDFVEGLRPIQDEDGNVGFERRDGIFKEFCKRAVESTLTGGSDNFNNVWDQLIKYLEDNIYIDIPLLTGARNIRIELNSYGTGLTERLYSDDSSDGLGEKVKGHSKFFTKEQLYNIYRGLKGVPSGGHDNYRKAIVDYLKTNMGLEEYSARQVNKSNEIKYVFIIDEINRGEISKIFGELFFSIDPGYRGIDGKVKTQYQNLVEQGDVFYEGFYVPENVYIIGTMNDIDRSVESMDFAFRRRFAFNEIKATDRVEMLDDLQWKDDSVNKMNRLNAEIEKIEGLSSAYHIGPAYFLKLNNYNGEFEQLWENHIEGLLREYMRGMQGVEEKIAKLKEAYNNPQAADNDDTGDNQ